MIHATEGQGNPACEGDPTFYYEGEANQKRRYQPGTVHVVHIGENNTKHLASVARKLTFPDKIKHAHGTINNLTNIVERTPLGAYHRELITTPNLYTLT